MAKRVMHPETMVIFKEDLDAFLAALEACLDRVEYLQRRYYALEIEPGGSELWHVPQVRAITPFSDTGDGAADRVE